MFGIAYYEGAVVAAIVWYLNLHLLM